jgi:hypothetical protein
MKNSKKEYAFPATPRPLSPHKTLVMGIQTRRHFLKLILFDGTISDAPWTGALNMTRLMMPFHTLE